MKEEFKLEETLTSNVERYDPALDTWTSVAPMPYPDAWHSVVVLGDGSALLSGSQGDARYEPDADRWTPLSGREGVGGCNAVALDDGNALAVGLYSGGAVAHRFDTATKTWAAVAPPQRFHRFCKLLRLASGEVMAVGGYADASFSPGLAVEIFSPSTNSWRLSGSLPFEIQDAVVLPSGDVLALGVTDGVPRALRWSASTDGWADAPAPLARPGAFAGFRRGGLVALGDDVLALFTRLDTPPVQRLDRTSGAWTYLNQNPVFTYKATRLSDGRVLTTGCDHPTGCVETAVLEP